MCKLKDNVLIHIHKKDDWAKRDDNKWNVFAKRIICIIKKSETKIE